MIRSRRARIALAVMAIALGCVEARAAEGGTVVTVVRPGSPDAMVNEAIARLSAELRAAGLTVRTIEASSRDGRAEVERVEGSFATIAIVTTDLGAVADVWIADRLTGKTVVRRVVVTDPALPTAASDLAVRSVELLRASLLELHEPSQRGRDVPAEISRFSAAPTPTPATAMIPATATASASSPPPSPPALAAPRSPERPRPSSAVSDSSVGASVEVAGALLLSPDAGASLRPSFRVALELPSQLSLRLGVAIPFDSSTLTAPSGTIDIRQTLFTLDAQYLFGPARWRFRPVASIGGGFYSLHVEGHATAPYMSERHDAEAGFGTVGVGLHIGLTEHLHVLADVQTIVLFPEQIVTAAGAPLARIGRPLFMPSIGLVAKF